jgi:peroxiredoxin-like protein
MQPFPHRYTASTVAASAGSITVNSEGLPPLVTNPPVEFDGPGDEWSPETLLVGAVAACFSLSFRAIAAASKFEWASLRCNVAGTIDRVERTVRFTAIEIDARLEVRAAADVEKGKRLLEKAKQNCFVTNSLVTDVQLRGEVQAA